MFILRYPILEMFTFVAEDQIGWKTNAAYAVTAEVTTGHRGLFRFYLSASSQSGNQELGLVRKLIEQVGAIMFYTCGCEPRGCWAAISFLVSLPG
jgi:hypothetical protein